MGSRGRDRERERKRRGGEKDYERYLGRYNLESREELQLFLKLIFSEIWEGTIPW